MTKITLRRNAPEASSTAACTLCGKHEPGGTKDHLLVGTPGVLAHDSAVCQECGKTLGHVVERFGSDLTVHVEEAQVRAGKRDTPLANEPSAVSGQPSAGRGATPSE